MPRLFPRVTSHLLTCALAVGMLSGACGQDLPEPATGVILVCIDTLRADHVGAYGYPRKTTPRIDRLATEGTVFEWAISQSNWTVPATATLLTSLYPSEHGAVIQGEIKHLDKTRPSGLRPNVKTLGDDFRLAGFRTGLFSANPFLQSLKRSFDAAEVKLQNAGSLTDKAIAWLHEKPAEPFFLHLQFMDLHQPLDPPEPYFSYFEVAEGGLRGPQHKRWGYTTMHNPDSASFRRYRAHKVALYDGALRYIDTEIGRLIDTLADLGLLDQTLLVVTSDHGEEFWDHADVASRNTGDPRGWWGIGHGHSMFQELLHVPLILHGPRVAMGARVECGARHLDVAPTILKLLELQPPPRMRGIDLTPLWQAERQGRPCESPPQLAESPAYGPEAQAVIWKQHKLIRIRNGIELLFDLRTDAAEQHDLSGDRPKVVEALGKVLTRELSRAESTTPKLGESEEMELDAELQRQLRALGYLTD